MEDQSPTYHFARLSAKPLTAISLAGLLSDVDWDFEDAIFILSGYYPPSWADSIVVSAVSDCIDNETPEHPVFKHKVRIVTYGSEPIEIPPECVSVAFLMCKEHFARASLKEKVNPSQTDENFSFELPLSEEEQIEKLLFEDGTVIKLQHQSPSAWINWAVEALGDAIPPLLKSHMKTESQEERAERYRAWSVNMSLADIARREGISRQRVSQIVGKGKKSAVKERESILRPDQLYTGKKKPR